jgi:hypothetical protein
MLKNGFWPKTRISPNLEDQFMDNGNMYEDFGVDTPFVGCRHDKPAPSFRVGRDVFASYFVILRQSDNNSHPFWIARAITNMNAKPFKHPNCMLIQYWKPIGTSDHIQDTYDGWNGVRPLQWKIDDCQPPIWERTDSIILAWKLEIRSCTKNPTMRILSCKSV